LLKKKEKEKERTSSVYGKYILVTLVQITADYGLKSFFQELPDFSDLPSVLVDLNIGASICCSLPKYKPKLPSFGTVWL